MNEVEKMYSNAGVKKYKKSYCDWDSNCPYPYHKCNDKCPYYKYEDNEQYPPFTAEKQIELIKWLGSKYGLYIVDKYSIGFGECIGDFCIKEDFEEALAGSTNSLWQDLTDVEKAQIKEILE